MTEAERSLVAAAQAARQGDWGRASAVERGRVLTRLGQLVLARVDELAALFDLGYHTRHLDTIFTRVFGNRAGSR